MAFPLWYTLPFNWDRFILQALIVGRFYHLQWVLPQLLKEAGFCVDAMGSAKELASSRFVRHFEYVPLSDPLAPRLAKMNQYDWIILTEDGILEEVASSSLPLEAKLRLLPVLKEENFSHLYSKIGLSRVLEAGGVKTPPFRVVHSREEAREKANEVGYPLFLKVDTSGGGRGVFECQKEGDIELLKEELFERPLLMQKKILGKELDVSPLYLQEDLVHFSYAIPEQVTHPWGPSFLRKYQPLHRVKREVFEELEQLGKVLGAHGFVNVSCIEDEKGERFYFEADMRPNVWVYTPTFWGEGMALRIRRWFSHREKLCYPLVQIAACEIVAPYLFRLRLGEILLNRYKAWQFIPKRDVRLILRIFFVHFFWTGINDGIIRWAKRIIPKRWHPFVKKSLKLIT